MDTFTLHIEIGNAAMETAGDVAKALHEIAEAIAAGESSGVIVDANGNTVGGFENAPEM